MSKVTIIIPCYNGSAFIETAVQSALQQTVDTRVIVVDDCSTDGSYALLEALAEKDPRLTITRQPANAGPSAARNAALKMVETEWVASLDADDYLLPDRMRRLIEHAERSDFDFLADDVIRVEPGQSPADGVRVWRDELIGEVPMGLAEFVRQNLSKYSGSRREIGYLKPLMRIEFLRRNDLYFREDMRLAEDYEFYTRSLIMGARWVITDPCGYIAVSMPESLSKAYPTRAIGKLVASDVRFLGQSGLSEDERSALREHLHITRTDYAWRTMIDGVRAKDPAMMVRALVQPPGVSAKVVARMIKHLLRMPILPEVPEEPRRTARETSRLGLT
ncbi:glycosyltransferase [Hyphomonas sp. WL0036]|uniref:glycosyltransferase family 2 protein n=1 Tax=Hyphomonas sediminis TaxID=2866160 RepID=UPI001C7EAC53|nr:glycosyltransferase family 2 protein [Hyphomonas sediminis]MBY9067951.1 glycosyltransferase [Hyphomonas sediminis]